MLVLGHCWCLSGSPLGLSCKSKKFLAGIQNIFWRYLSDWHFSEDIVGSCDKMPARCANSWNERRGSNSSLALRGRGFHVRWIDMKYGKVKARCLNAPSFHLASPCNFSQLWCSYSCADNPKYERNQCFCHNLRDEKFRPRHEGWCSQ